MDYTQIEHQFREKLEGIYTSHETIRTKFERDEFINMFTIKYVDGRPRQPVEPEGKEVDTMIFQLVMAAFNDVYP